MRRIQKDQLQAYIRSERRAVLIVNTRSRRGQNAFKAIKRELAEAGFSLDGDYPLRDPSRLPEVVSMAVARGAKLVIIGGGDGTISSAADSFAYHDVALGIIPLGTANSFARTLSIPLDVKGAVSVLATGKVADVDLGSVDGDYFANATAIGLPAGIARSVPHLLKKVAGRLGYVLTAAWLLGRFKPFRSTIRMASGEQRVFESTLEIRIANGPFKGGVMASSGASLESGELVMDIVVGQSPLRLARVWMRLAAGLRLKPGDVEQITSSGFRIETEPRQYVSIDGEAVTQTPVDINVGHQALRIIVPADRADLT